eukprot:619926-Lingulodinium_polyedra.AAC.1
MEKYDVLLGTTFHVLATNIATQKTLQIAAAIGPTRCTSGGRQAWSCASGGRTSPHWEPRPARCQ